MKTITKENVATFIHTNNLAERTILFLLRGWLDYAKMHNSRYQSLIGDDYVLGPEWENIGKAILGLLNGETGDLDCGSIDKLIRQEFKINNCSIEY